MAEDGWFWNPASRIDENCIDRLPCFISGAKTTIDPIFQSWHRTMSACKRFLYAFDSVTTRFWHSGVAFNNSAVDAFRWRMSDLALACLR